MAIARGEKFEKVVIHLPPDAKNVPAGLEMTMGSRPKLIVSFCFANKVSELNKTYLFDIGKGDANAQRRAFQDEIIDSYKNADKARVMREIGELDPLGLGSYDRRCAKLLKWHRTMFWGWDMSNLSDEASSW